MIRPKRWLAPGIESLVNHKVDCALDQRLRRLRLASRFSQETDFVFASRDGTPLGHRNVDRRGFEPARDLAGLPGSLTFHELRHAFASRAAHRGVPLNVLSEIMGHATIAVTSNVCVHLYGRAAAEDAFRVAMAR